MSSRSLPLTLPIERPLFASRQSNGGGLCISLQTRSCFLDDGDWFRYSQAMTGSIPKASLSNKCCYPAGLAKEDKIALHSHKIATKHLRPGGGRRHYMGKRPNWQSVVACVLGWRLGLGSVYCIPFPNPLFRYLFWGMWSICMLPEQRSFMLCRDRKPGVHVEWIGLITETYEVNSTTKKADIFLPWHATHIKSFINIKLNTAFPDKKPHQLVTSNQRGSSCSQR